MRHPTRRSKIVCTIGPAVASASAIEDLITAGMDVARINFSHGRPEEHAQTIRWLREASKKLGTTIAVLGDLQGPKIRTGKLKMDNQEVTKIEIEKGQTLFFRGGDTQDKELGSGEAASPIRISYPRLATDLRPGDIVLFDDGLIKMQVLDSKGSENWVSMEVIAGRVLGENKGVNMPGAKLSTLGITEKDWEDIHFGLENDVDFLAMSFVRTSREVKNLKGFLAQKASGIQVIAKIEKAEAIENIDDILQWADGIMVARGDLGVEIGNEKVPLVQKQLIQKTRFYGKPVITATQMLMSMVQNPTPTRAEASDIANAVFDGSDALMLSNETATGQYPLEAVRTMSDIIKGAETLAAGEFREAPPEMRLSDGRLDVSEAIESAATNLAKNLRAKCIAALTRSGQAARYLAKYRPQVPIYAFAENEKVRSQLCLSWGVFVVPWKEMPLLDHSVFDDLLNELARRKLIRNFDISVMTAGIPTSLKQGATNTVVVKEYNASP